jgi:hypothetical protein
MSSARTYITDRVVTKDDPKPDQPTPPNCIKSEERTHFEIGESHQPIPPTSSEPTVSAKQLVANRKNARLSTGPKTPQGKAVSAGNSLKHGLYARCLLLKSKHHSESFEDYQQLIDSLYEELQPETLFQEHLVRKIANCLWRSRRAAVAEAAHINHELADVDYEVRRDIENRALVARLQKDPVVHETSEDEQDAMVSHEVGKCLILDKETNQNILWYEMRLDRQLMRAYVLLNFLKKRPTPGLSDPTPGYEIES